MRQRAAFKYSSSRVGYRRHRIKLPLPC
jgi:hypothetical protein